MSVIQQMQEQHDSGGGGGDMDDLSDMLQRCSINNLFGRVGMQFVPTPNTQEVYPNSPEVALTPKSAVPSSCFPPTNTRNYISYSEVGSNMNGNTNGSPEPSSSPSLSEVGDIFSAWARTTQKGFTVNAKTIEISVSPAGLNGAVWGCEWESEEPWQYSALIEWHAFATGVNIKETWFGPKAVGRSSSGGYSTKVFLGGLPWDVTEPALIRALEPFGTVDIEWPVKDGIMSPRGYAYVMFESEQAVRRLLAACESRKNGAYFYRVSSRKIHAKQVQVIPWSLGDTNYVRCNSVKLDPCRTVFVGALHGMLSATSLAVIMDKLFGGVVYAGIDTDRNKYPIGSGRVTFDNMHSYMLAVKAAYIEINTEKLYKKIQVDPYLEDSVCSVCKVQQGPYFCREVSCFQYFCRSCWQWQHSIVEHKALTRNSKSYNGDSKCGNGPQSSKSGSRMFRGSQDSLHSGSMLNGPQSPGEQRSTESPSLLNGINDVYNHVGKNAQFHNQGAGGGNGLVNGVNHDFNGPGPNLKGGTLCNGFGYSHWTDL